MIVPSLKVCDWKTSKGCMARVRMVSHQSLEEEGQGVLQTVCSVCPGNCQRLLASDCHRGYCRQTGIPGGGHLQCRLQIPLDLFAFLRSSGAGCGHQNCCGSGRKCHSNCQIHFKGAYYHSYRDDYCYTSVLIAGNGHCGCGVAPSVNSRLLFPFFLGQDILKRCRFYPRSCGRNYSSCLLNGYHESYSRL